MEEKRWNHSACHTHNILLSLNQDIFSIQRGGQVILVLEFIAFCSTRCYFSIIMYYNLLQFAVQYDMESTIVANNSFPVWKNRDLQIKRLYSGNYENTFQDLIEDRRFYQKIHDNHRKCYFFLSKLLLNVYSQKCIF